jgi:hypothetical protein
VYQNHETYVQFVVAPKVLIILFPRILGRAQSREYRIAIQLDDLGVSELGSWHDEWHRRSYHLASLLGYSDNALHFPRKDVYGRNFEHNTWSKYSNFGRAECDQDEVLGTIPEILIYLRSDN